MARLDDKVKRFIVQALACFDTPSQVAAAVKDEFGIDISRMQVATYDPMKATGSDLSPKWRAIFEQTRKKFLDDVSAIPIAQQSFRLRALNRMLRLAEDRKNAALAAQLLEQAAKEVGGAFTNRRELTGKGGGPMQIASAADLSDDELAAIAKGAAPQGGE
jgi:hypothetical protein